MSENTNEKCEGSESYERGFPSLTQFVINEVDHMCDAGPQDENDIDAWFNKNIQRAFPQIVQILSDNSLLDNITGLQIMLQRLERTLSWLPLTEIEGYYRHREEWVSVPYDDEENYQCNRCPALFFYPNHPKDKQYMHVEHAYYYDTFNRSSYTTTKFDLEKDVASFFYDYLKKSDYLKLESSRAFVEMPFMPQHPVKLEVNPLIDADLSTVNAVSAQYNEWLKTDHRNDTHTKPMKPVTIYDIHIHAMIFPKEELVVVTADLYDMAHAFVTSIELVLTEVVIFREDESWTSICNDLTHLMQDRIDDLIEMSRKNNDTFYVFPCFSNMDNEDEDTIHQNWVIKNPTHEYGRNSTNEYMAQMKYLPIDFSNATYNAFSWRMDTYFPGDYNAPVNDGNAATKWINAIKAKHAYRERYRATHKDIVAVACDDCGECTAPPPKDEE